MKSEGQNGMEVGWRGQTVDLNELVNTYLPDTSECRVLPWTLQGGKEGRSTEGNLMHPLM